MTIADVQRSIAEKFQSFVRSGEFEPWIKRDYDVRVSIQRYRPTTKRPRKVREDASEAYWSPDSCVLAIEFGMAPVPLEPVPSKLRSNPITRHGESIPQAIVNPRTDALAELVRLLDSAESRPGYNFVALKWFRDVAMGSAGLNVSEHERQTLLSHAIEEDIVRTHRVNNPKHPQFPVTAIRLNRQHKLVRATLGGGVTVQKNAFRPIAMRGEELSQTVLRDRR